MKVLIGLSGGVDSAVATALLKEAGHDVSAFTLILGHVDPDGVHRCCSPDDIRDARSVAGMLDVPHYVWDYKDLFRENVMKPFLEGYESGITPNPCGMCNRTVRFGAVFDRVKRLGFDALATGHYARVEADGLYRALDRKKDQSYFLSRLRPDVVPHLIFPLAHLTKARVRDIANDLSLPTAKKRESQEICFVSGKTANFLEQNIGNRPGDIVDEHGKVLGQHKGVHLYTIGQRKGLGISSPYPLFVTRLDSVKNRVIVGPRASTESRYVKINDLNCFTEINAGDKVNVQLRHQSNEIPAEISDAAKDSISLKLLESAFAPAAGQIAVMYKNERVIASGIIAV